MPPSMGPLVGLHPACEGRRPDPAACPLLMTRRDRAAGSSIRALPSIEPMRSLTCGPAPYHDRRVGAGCGRTVSVHNPRTRRRLPRGQALDLLRSSRTAVDASLPATIDVATDDGPRAGS